MIALLTFWLLGFGKWYGKVATHIVQNKKTV